MPLHVAVSRRYKRWLKTLEVSKEKVSTDNAKTVKIFHKAVMSTKLKETTNIYSYIKRVITMIFASIVHRWSIYNACNLMFLDISCTFGE